MLFIDILVTLNTSYLEKGVLENSRKKILIKYQQKCLLFDLLIMIPFIIYLL